MEENSQLGETSKSGFSYSSRDKDKESKKKEDQHGEKPKKYNNYPPLQVSLVDVFREVCHTEKIPPPRPIKSKKGGENRTEYCEYHRIYGHPTNECFDLKNVIEKLDEGSPNHLAKGTLKKYTVHTLGRAVRPGLIKDNSTDLLGSGIPDLFSKSSAKSLQRAQAGPNKGT
ncbi:hypothetical protein AHAS_Ahas20G0232500 [Arachis hypogaea]